MTGRAFLCRCEDISVEEVREAIRDGYRDVESLKRFTAYGTGPCQGKECIPLALALLSEETGLPPESLEPPTLRSPVMPVSLGALARLEEDVPGDPAPPSRETRRNEPP